jgi:hypothetical protein
MRDRVHWLMDRTVFVPWESQIPRHASAIRGTYYGSCWQVILATQKDRPVGRVSTWVEPPVDVSSGQPLPLAGVLGLDGMCTAPDSPGISDELVDWARKYAVMLGLETVRIAATSVRLRDHYQERLGFVVKNEAPLGQGRILWEMYRDAKRGCRRSTR